MRVTDFKIPTRIEEARRQLKGLGNSGFFLAGGTSLVFNKGKAGRVAVDISRLGLDKIKKEGRGFMIGANARIADLQEYHANGWVLDRVAHDFVTQQIRNICTIGGNVASIFRWNDFPVALMVLDCELTIQGRKKQKVSGEEYFKSQPRRFYADQGILTSIKVGALPAGTGFGYRKELKTAADFSMVTAAAVAELDGGKIKSLRVAAGSALPFPRRLTAVEKLLTGVEVPKGCLCEGAFMEQVKAGIADIPWKGYVGLSDAYAAQLAAVTVRDAIAAAVKEVRCGGKNNG
ncbi:MAG: FAD binding domain-containing protein [Elusimicrobiota bacterium]